MNQPRDSYYLLGAWFLGWVVALSCYVPFNQVVFGQYLNYNFDKYYWGHWLSDNPVLYVLWGGVILLLLVNGIYYLRAITEERHLSADPVYQQYTGWIAEHGLFAKGRRKVRAMLLLGLRNP